MQTATDLQEALVGLCRTLQQHTSLGVDANRQYSREEFCQIMGIKSRTWRRWLSTKHARSGVPFKDVLVYVMGQPRIYGADFIAWSKGEVLEVPTCEQ